MSSNHPNPRAAQALLQRVYEWQLEKSMQEELTDTQKVYQPAAALAQQFQEQFMALQAALTNGDLHAANQARIKIANIEAEQRQAAMVMRQHLIDKASHKGTVSHNGTSPA